MRVQHFFGPLIATALFWGAALGETPAERSLRLRREAEQVALMYTRGQMARIRELSSVTLASRVSEDSLRRRREAVLEASGDLKVIQAAQIRDDESLVVPLEFDRGIWELRLAFADKDEGLLIDGLELAQRVDATPAKPVFPFRDADYVDPSKFQQFTIAIPDSFAGRKAVAAVPTGLQPDERRPAVLILGDYVTTDADGTTKGNKPLRDLALGLASRGFVTLRMGLRAGDVRPPDPLDTRSRVDIAEDERAALALLINDARVQPRGIVIIGMGVGARQAMAIAADNPTVRLLLLQPEWSYTPDAIRAVATRSAVLGFSVAEEASVFESMLRSIADGSANRNEPLAGLPADFWVRANIIEPNFALQNGRIPTVVWFFAEKPGEKPYIPTPWNELTKRNKRLILQRASGADRYLLPLGLAKGTATHVDPAIIDNISIQIKLLQDQK